MKYHITSIRIINGHTHELKPVNMIVDDLERTRKELSKKNNGYIVDFSYITIDKAETD